MRIFLLLISMLLLLALAHLGTRAGYLSETMAAWAQAILSVGAILASVWLQDRDRLLRARAERRSQIFALHAIAERCVALLEKLDKKAQGEQFQKSDFNWLSEEAAADEETVSRIDLMQIANPALIREVSKLCRAMRRAKRRLGYARTRVENGQVPSRDNFQNSFAEAVTVTAALEEMKKVRIFR